MKIRILICLLFMSMSQHGMSLSIGDDLLKQFDEYVSDMKTELERKYEARFQTLKTELKRRVEARFQVLEHKFSSDLAAMKSEFVAKENEYMSRIETLESIVGQLQENLKEKKTSVLTDDTDTRPTIVANKKEIQSKKRIVDFRSGVDDSNTDATRQASVQKDNKVAFFASLSNTLTNLGQNQDIAFDKIDTNLGSAYNGHHGIFVAPVAGTYVFFATLFSAFRTWGVFMVNNVPVAKLYIEGTGHQSSQAIIAHLNKGDAVAIQNVNTGKSVDGYMYSTFGGFLLYADDAAEIIG